MGAFTREIGRVAPFRPEGEGALCLLDKEGLSLFVFKRLEGAADAERFARGELRWGVYAAGVIPFFLVSIRDFGDIAVAVNILAQPGEARRNFAEFPGEGEARLVLCGFPTPEIAGLRRFVLRADVIEELRQADAIQTRVFEDASACAAAAAYAMSRHSPGRMLGATVLYPEKPCD